MSLSFEDPRGITHCLGHSDRDSSEYERYHVYVPWCEGDQGKMMVEGPARLTCFACLMARMTVAGSALLTEARLEREYPLNTRVVRFP